MLRRTTRFLRESKRTAQPKNARGLRRIILNTIKKEGPECDLNFIDTSLITDMSYLFYKCENLKTINFTDSDTSKVTNMSHMFQNCKSLQTFDLAHLNTVNVTDMSYMFAGAAPDQVFIEPDDPDEGTTISLVIDKFDVTFLNTSNVTNMRYMIITLNVNYLSILISKY